MATIKDIPLLITSPTSSSERRITPTWTISQLKSKLEPITGIAPSAQRLILRLPDQNSETPIVADDEDVAQIGNWPLAAYAELKVLPTHPSVALLTTDTSSVPKTEMPISTYESLHGTVLDFKKSHQIGRFDPAADEKNRQKVARLQKDVEDRGIKEGSRCHLTSQPTRRGTIRYLGPIPSLPGLEGAPWAGVELDEPFGKNDGSITTPTTPAPTPSPTPTPDPTKEGEEKAAGEGG
ncbi:uncharacterized protein KY384_000351 [Bacidia gigantensis]|uniref:uncharacterized protein n=1 Tax=Bacidia gigantensis TaxID=2732470 RepID=UPI001D03B39D|nr:uncharacterized protein KY384_000351 [Bacidia gigantensis]KAG8526358.1 hypothetical protein KY384_000351 [Bacidia gigantensis]